MARGKILLLAVFWASLADAQTDSRAFHDVPLTPPHCETFTVGESGHSDRCAGPAGYGLIVHYRRARIDLEITRPGEERGAKVHRLVDHLADGQRSLARNVARWLEDEGRAVAFALSFDVEPQPYEATIPLSLVFRVHESGEDCVIATIGEGSKRVLDDVMKEHAELKCRPAFPQ